MLAQFLPRYNRRFRVPPQCPEPAFRPLDPELRLKQALCFKHRRRVARDDTVKFQRHTLQLLPSQQRRTYAGAAVVVLEGLAGRLSVQYEGRIIASQEAPPSPGALRNGKWSSVSATAPSPVPEPLGGPQTAPLEQLIPKIDGTEDYGAVGDREEMVGMTVSATPRNPTFSSEGKVEGSTAGQAERAVHPRNGEGAGNPQGHGKEIHGLRESTDPAVSGRSTGAGI